MRFTLSSRLHNARSLIALQRSSIFNFAAREQDLDIPATSAGVSSDHVVPESVYRYRMHRVVNVYMYKSISAIQSLRDLLEADWRRRQVRRTYFLFFESGNQY